MKHLVDKDKILAKIEEAIDGPVPLHDQQCPWEDGYYCGLYKAEGIINTLEVKEVDLEEEAELIANDIMIGVQANRYNTVVYNTKRCDFNHSHLMLAARKGIELGLKAYKGK